MKKLWEPIQCKILPLQSGSTETQSTVHTFGGSCPFAVATKDSNSRCTKVKTLENILEDDLSASASRLEGMMDRGWWWNKREIPLRDNTISRPGGTVRTKIPKRAVTENFAGAAGQRA